jgi:hypothetical protein
MGGQVVAISVNVDSNVTMMTEQSQSQQSQQQQHDLSRFLFQPTPHRARPSLSTRVLFGGRS